MAQIEFGSPEVLSPRIPWPGTRVTGVALAQGVLVFRADGGVAPGIYAQDLSGPNPAPRALFRDFPGSFHVHPVPAGPLLALHRCRVGRIPPAVVEVVFTRHGAEVLTVPGQSVGVSGDGRVALVADLQSNALHRVDLEARTAAKVAAFWAGMNPMVAPVPALDHEGRRALFMDARQDVPDGSLEQLELDTGEIVRVRPPLPPPGRVCGALAPDGRSAVVLEMAMASGPAFRLLRLRGGAEDEVLALPLAQPLTPPVFVDGRTVCVPLSLRPFPGESHGPVELVAVDLDTREAVSLTKIGDARGRVRRDGGAVLLEGGAAAVRVPVRGGQP